MAGLHIKVSTSQAITIGTSPTQKTLLSYTAPAGGARVNKIVVEGEATSTTAAKGQVNIVKGGSGGTSSSPVSPVKSHGHTGSPAGTSKEAYSANPTGGTVIDRGSFNTYGGKVFPDEIILNPNEMIEVQAMAAAPVGATVNMYIEE